jgi:hypothetical protein
MIDPRVEKILTAMFLLGHNIGLVVFALMVLMYGLRGYGG